MADTDLSVTEILRKAVEADIEKRVYDKIKTDLLHLKFVGGFAGVLVLLLFTFHERVFTSVVDWGGKQLEDRIERSIDHENTRLDTTRDLFFKDQEVLLSKMSGMRDEISGLNDEITRRKSEVADLVVVLNEAGDTTRDRIATAQSEALARAKEQADAIVAKIVALQNAIASDLKKSSPSGSAAEVEKVDVRPTAVAEQKPVVYFQFAGFERKEAEQISKAIQNAGWTIPGEERTPKAAKTNVIRYNPDNPADARAAKLLQTEANKVLSDLRLQLTLELERNPNVTPGFVEIWIYKR
jgi:hypothetical protein